jgi:hypothetical protein
MRRRINRLWVRASLAATLMALLLVGGALAHLPGLQVPKAHAASGCTHNNEYGGIPIPNPKGIRYYAIWHTTICTDGPHGSIFWVYPSCSVDHVYVDFNNSYWLGQGVIYSLRCYLLHNGQEIDWRDNSSYDPYPGPQGGNPATAIYFPEHNSAIGDDWEVCISGDAAYRGIGGSKTNVVEYAPSDNVCTLVRAE